MTEPARTSGWKRFWDRGGWWKAVLAAVVYLALYVGASQLIGLLFASELDSESPFGSASTVFFTLVLPIAVGSAILLAFAASVGWLGELFGPQPIGGRGWMWIAPALVLLAAILRAAGTDYGQYSVGVVLLTYLAGLFIGLSEELLTRGIAVSLLRRAGYSELVVMLLSSVVFALLHATNLLTGQPPLTVLVTMVFAFFFGVMMYLTLRVTGRLIWPILLHAITDPSTFLATGGIDVSSGTVSPLVGIAGLSTYAYALLAIVALFLVRGRVAPKQEAFATPR